MMKQCLISLAVWFFLLFLFNAETAVSKNEFNWSGQFRVQGSAGHYDDEHILVTQHPEQLFLNGGLDGRLNGSFYSGDHTSFHIAYEAVLSGGETRKAITDITKQHPGSEQTLVFQNTVPSDDQQFFSLTKIISDEDAFILYHRIDRLFLAYESNYGNFNIGRQPVTWGNGLLFNPADLINPFAPSDIIRDYKIGSDMILYQHGFGNIQDIQLVAVPRRDEDGDLSADESTLGLKGRFSSGDKDFDVFIMKNYQDPVIGGGMISYVGDGVLRTDITWTSLDDDSDRNSFFSGVANYDYSWTWMDKNWYGFLEFYYNGLGSSNVYEVSNNDALSERLERGEIFVTGRYYLNGLLQFEAHPLVNMYSTIIYNLEDNSFLFQPRLSWDFTSSSQFLIGANIPIGSTDAEFGKLVDPDTGLVVGNPVQVYLLLTTYF